MRMEEQIGNWADMIRESMLDEVSDVDVDWSSDAMDDNRIRREASRMGKLGDLATKMKDSSVTELTMLVGFLLYVAQNAKIPGYKNASECARLFLNGTELRDDVVKLLSDQFDQFRDMRAQDAIEKTKEEAGISDRREIDGDEI